MSNNDYYEGIVKTVFPGVKTLADVGKLILDRDKYGVHFTYATNIKLADYLIKHQKDEPKEA